MSEDHLGAGGGGGTCGGGATTVYTNETIQQRIERVTAELASLVREDTAVLADEIDALVAHAQAILNADAVAYKPGVIAEAKILLEHNRAVLGRLRVLLDNGRLSTS